MKKNHQAATVSGVLLLDKPSGLSSNAALSRIKSLLNIRKAGHTGSLDPIATGLLPVCLGEATKVAGFFLNADKHYRTRIKLGEATDTGDRDGQITHRRKVAIQESELTEVLESFIGELEQVPPMYSAVKMNGQPLYKLARRGIEVERSARRVTIYHIELLDFSPDSFEIIIHCSSGFYVRVLAAEIGERLHCGGHVVSLRRLGVGALKIEDSHTLEQIEQIDSVTDRHRLVKPGDQTLTHLPEINLSFDAAFYLCRGQTVRAVDLPSTGLVRLYEKSVGFLGIGVSLGDGRVAPKRLFHASSA